MTLVTTNKRAVVLIIENHQFKHAMNAVSPQLHFYLLPSLKSSHVFKHSIYTQENIITTSNNFGQYFFCGLDI